MAAEFRKIIAPIDGSKEAKKAARKALYMAKHMDLEVVALYVVDTSLLAKFPAPEDVTSFDIDKFLQKEGLDALDEVEEMGREMGVKVEKKMVEGIPDQEIIEMAHQKDLIVMGSKGMTALDRILIGSVSEKVMHHAPCPVMIVRG
ncbi:MAG TPA: universal stress protein [Thermoplasmatales archaeon]|nr:universal stress protein [Candidatus Thermoplasmatota archaeon]HDS59414.1 universal stress protein [Thermoplasmatales archaeon]